MKRHELDRGVHGFVGETRTGKTYAAFELFKELCARRPRGSGVVLDWAGAQNFADKPHAPSAAHALATAYTGGIAYFTPKEDREGDLLLLGLLGTSHGMPILIDEASWGNTRKGSPFDRLCRTWAHHDTTILLVSQDLTRDLSTTFLNVSPRTLHVFRCNIPPDLRSKARWIGIDPEKVATLRDRERVTIKRGH